MTSTLFFSFIGSLVISMALIPPLMATASRLHILDLPEARKSHQIPVARVGGIAFAIGTFIALLVWAPKDDLVVASLIGGLIILLFGVWDDRSGLNYHMKFAGQAIASITVILIGDVHLTSLPLLESPLSPWLSTPLTLLILLGVTNAVNLADGLDGLAGGLSLLSFAAMGYLAYLATDTSALILITSVLGGLLGFLRFNTYPARVFMGDGGSQFLGFNLAVIALALTDSTRGPFSPPLALFLLGLPILDTIGVMSQRIMEGRSPFVADRNHVHHKLLSIGLSHYEAVLTIYVIQAGMVGGACLLRWSTDAMVIGIYLVVASTILAVFVKPDRFGVAHLRPAVSRWLKLARLDEFTTSRWIASMPIRLLAGLIPSLLIASIALPLHVPGDMGIASLLLFAVVLTGLLLAPRWAPLLVRAGLYVGATFLLFLSSQAIETMGWGWKYSFNGLFIFLGLLVVVTIRFNDVHRFQTTPLDYLMIFVALAIPMLPEIRIGQTELSLLVGKLLVLFFSFELLLHAFFRRVGQLGLVSLWILFGIGVRSWF